MNGLEIDKNLNELKIISLAYEGNYRHFYSKPRTEKELNRTLEIIAKNKINYSQIREELIKKGANPLKIPYELNHLEIRN